jgi:molecular chaperone DnaJ
VTRDYYEVLGVPRGADAAAIKDAFRKLAMQSERPGAEARKLWEKLRALGD